jgi:hypothetical protein
MEVLKLTAKTDASGNLRLNLPTQLVAVEVNVVVVLTPALSDQQSASRYDFSTVAGRLTWQGDAIAMQRMLRDEW